MIAFVVRNLAACTLLFGLVWGGIFGFLLGMMARHKQAHEAGWSRGYKARARQETRARRAEAHTRGADDTLLLPTIDDRDRADWIALDGTR